MYATDRRQTKASLNAPPTWGGGITNRSVWLRLEGQRPMLRHC